MIERRALGRTGLAVSVLGFGGSESTGRDDWRPESLERGIARSLERYQR